MNLIELIMNISEKNKTESNYELRDLLEENTNNHGPEDNYMIFNSD